MLVTKEWSAPQRITYGRNVTLQYSQPGLAVKIYNAAGAKYETQITGGKKAEIKASEIMHVAHPMISLQTLGIAETHVHIDCPDF